MDTGNYMANQMSDQIDASFHQYEEFCQDLEKEITDFIKKSGYSWTSEQILDEYTNKYSKGYYVSHTAKKIIEEFEDRLKLIFT